MVTCFLMFAGVCISPMGLQNLSYEHVYGIIFSAEFQEFNLEIISGDHVRAIDKKKSPKICHNDVCASYHQYCYMFENNQLCQYQIQRSDRLESLLLRVTAKQQDLPPNWRAKFSIIYGTGTEQNHPLSELEQISHEKEWPKARVYRRLDK